MKNYFSSINTLTRHEQFILISLSVISFLLPFSTIVISYIGITALLVWLFNIKLNQHLPTLLSDKLFILYASFYLVGAISLLYTQNLDNGLRKMETKASLLLIPMVISSLPNLKNHYKFVCWFHVLGNVSALLICLVLSTLRFAESKDTNEFFYSNLSFFEHSGYFTMNIIFALSFVGYRLGKCNSWQHLIAPSLLLIFLLIGAFLLSSRTGIIALPFILIILLSYALRKRLSKLNVILANAVLLLTTISVVAFVPKINMRMKALVDEVIAYKNPSEAIGAVEVRIAIWTQSKKIIAQNPWFGVGIGDAEDELFKVYKEMNMHKTLEKKYNAHNQFVQTQISLGLMGSLIQAAILILLLIYSIKRRKILAFCLFVVLFTNFLTESILERQAGVVFFSLFVPILLNFKETKNEK